MNPLIIALDVDTAEQALKLVDQLGDTAGFYKVGMELYAATGLEVVNELHSRGKRVFLDLKLYDIGETVKRATRQICLRSKADFLTVHGSRTVMQAAREGREGTATELLAVSVLTSFDAEDLADLGYPPVVEELVALRVRKALESQLDGVVCSPLDLVRVRKIAGSQLKLITPGVRSGDASVGDQKRVATPREAVENGADHLVIGRQVTRAPDPKAACEKILAELRA